MGRREQLVRRARRAGRAALDRGSASIDRAGTVVRDRLARRGHSEEPPPSVQTVPPAPLSLVDARPDDISTPTPIDDLASLTKVELYRLAQERDIEGRSKLSKDELVKVLQSTAD
ncbi:MAG: Rho termination factor N-terminal domain-containing protein [Acidimicrobiales bacterium]